MRKHYIDNLRSILILILIPYHAAMAWNVWEEPNYIFFDGNRIISSIVVFFSPFFMAALFMLAGISTCFALKKKTFWQSFRKIQETDYSVSFGHAGSYAAHNLYCR